MFYLWECLSAKMAIIKKNFISTCQKNLTIKQFDKRKICYFDICVNHPNPGRSYIWEPHLQPSPWLATVPLLHYAPLTWQRYGGSGTDYTVARRCSSTQRYLAINSNRIDYSVRQFALKFLSLSIILVSFLDQLTQFKITRIVAVFSELITEKVWFKLCQ